jgi:hypothetical protein
LKEAQIEESVWQENCVNADESSKQTILINESTSDKNSNKRHKGKDGVFKSRNDTSTCLLSDDGINNNHHRMLGGTTDLMQTTVLNALIPVLHVI